MPARGTQALIGVEELARGHGEAPARAGDELHWKHSNRTDGG